MIDIASALLASLAYGLSAVLARRRLNESNFFSVAFVISVTGNVILWPFTFLFTNMRTVNPEGVLFFAMAGLLAPGIVPILYFKGMEVVGVSVNASLYAIYPMFSSILAVLLLGEAPAPENWIGIICIVTSVLYLERGLSGLRIGNKKILRKDLVFSIFAGLAASFAFIIRKHGLNIYNEPLLGVAVGYASSFLLYLPVLIYSYSGREPLVLGKDLRLFWKAGVSMSLAWILLFYALSHGKVSVVTPLIQTQPLFVLFFTYLCLKEMEQISSRLILSTFLIIIGVMLITTH